MCSLAYLFSRRPYSETTATGNLRDHAKKKHYDIWAAAAFKHRPDLLKTGTEKPKQDNPKENLPYSHANLMKLIADFIIADDQVSHFVI